MKKALVLFLVLVLCLPLSLSALADEAYVPPAYGELTLTGLSDFYDPTDVTVTFEAARWEIGSFYFTWDGEHFNKVEGRNIITVKPGSKVTVTDSKSGDKTRVEGFVMLQGFFTFIDSDEFIWATSGSISDWPLGEKALSTLGDYHTIGLLCFAGKEFFYIRLGESDDTQDPEPAPDPTPAPTPEPTPEPTPAPEPEELQVRLTNQRLTVDGTEQTAEIYNINGSNYFKLRDIAMLLNGTGSQFSVGYDDAAKTISVTTGAPYEPVGGELVMGEDRSASCVVSSQSLTVNGEAVDLKAYNLGGNNFFGLRDLGSVLGFDVDYDAESRTMLVTSRTAQS